MLFSQATTTTKKQPNFGLHMSLSFSNENKFQVSHTTQASEKHTEKV